MSKKANIRIKLDTLRIATASVIGVAALAAVSGCGAVDAASNGDSNVEGDVADAEFESVGQAFSESSCATATADWVIDGDAPNMDTSPTSYNTCGKGWVVDIDNIDRADFGPNLDPGTSVFTKTIKVEWAASAPTTQSECQNSEVSSYMYKWNSGSGTYVAVGPKKTSMGVWSSNACRIPVNYWRDRANGSSDVTYTQNAEYRVAATARASNGTVRMVMIDALNGTP